MSQNPFTPYVSSYNTSSALGTYLNNRPSIFDGYGSGGVDATSGAAYQAELKDYVKASATNPEKTLGYVKEYVEKKHGNSDDSGLDPNGVDWIGYYSASGSNPNTPQQLQYIDAPMAEAYGMDVSTAYQEALANTAYQRKVKDLKAAGLNPILGYSGAGAASFYGTPDAGVSSSGGVSFGSLGSAKSTNGLTDKQKDTLLRNLPNAIGGVVSIVKGPSAGAATSAIGNAVANIIRYW